MGNQTHGSLGNQTHKPNLSKMDSKVEEVLYNEVVLWQLKPRSDVLAQLIHNSCLYWPPPPSICILLIQFGSTCLLCPRLLTGAQYYADIA